MMNNVTIILLLKVTFLYLQLIVFFRKTEKCLAKTNLRGIIHYHFLYCNKIYEYLIIVKNNSILFNEQIMMAITREDDFVRNSSERVIAIIREPNTILFLRL
jgi:hypothetical protein